MVDSGSYVRWLERFRAAAGGARLWGLHNYGDVTYGTSSRTDAALAAVPGTLWIEETGGIVTLRDAAGVATLPASETRAAAAIDRAFAIARGRRRIARMYVYQWQAAVADRFDSGLVRPDGTQRASYARLAAGLAALPASTTAAATTLRWQAAWSRRTPSRLVVRVTCRAADRICRGTVAVRLRGHRLATRAYRTSARQPATALRIAVSRAIRARARAASSRPLVLSAHPARPAAGPTTTVLKLARPA